MTLDPVLISIGLFVILAIVGWAISTLSDGGADD